VSLIVKVTASPDKGRGGKAVIARSMKAAKED
jgi:hypothetical protein